MTHSHFPSYSAMKTLVAKRSANRQDARSGDAIGAGDALQGRGPAHDPHDLCLSTREVVNSLRLYWSTTRGAETNLP